jgi:DNA uptake protein ComE-like DNA-binding protein
MRYLAVPLMCLAMLLPPLAPAVGQRAPVQAPAALTPGTESSSEPLDLNTASMADLAALPGMGRAYARRVAEGRPYVAKNQLVTRGILPQATYERIKNLIVARRKPRTSE